MENADKNPIKNITRWYIYVYIYKAFYRKYNPSTTYK